MRWVSPQSVLLLAAADLALVSANPYPRDDLHDAGFAYLMPRQCGTYCGAENQLCCSGGRVCTTLDGDIATCVAAGGRQDHYVTTWTETRTFTSTIQTYWEPAPEPTEGVDCVPQNDEQEACGPICCAGWQTCGEWGQCSAKPGMGDGTTVIITTDGRVTTQYSAPYRITGTTTVVTSGTSTATQTSVRETQSSDSDNIGAGDGDGGGGGGLSAGAIAGIVIGSIAGVALLLLLCFCCIARGLWNAIFGGKKKRTERVDVYEEGYSRHGSTHGRRERHGGWFGGLGGGGRPASASGRDEKKSGGKRWLGLAGLAATMLALLNLKKDKKPARRGGSRYSNSYYSYSDASGTRSSSSGGRTRRSHPGSRVSRGPPRSHYTGGSPRR